MKRMEAQHQNKCKVIHWTYLCRAKACMNPSSPNAWIDIIRCPQHKGTKAECEDAEHEDRVSENRVGWLKCMECWEKQQREMEMEFEVEMAKAEAKRLEKEQKEKEKARREEARQAREARQKKDGEYIQGCKDVRRNRNDRSYFIN